MFITKIEEHEEYKERLLNLISEMPDSSYETVTKTDWNLDADIPREAWSEKGYSNFKELIAKEFITEEMKSIGEKIMKLIKYGNKS
jgi:hypothetical protein